MARAGRGVVVVTGLGLTGLVAVAAWCVWVVLSTGALRGEVEHNVGILSGLSTLRARLEARPTALAADPTRPDAGVEAHRLGALAVAEVPTAAEAARALDEAVAAVRAGGGEPAVRAAGRASDELVRAVRLRNRQVSTTLGDRWTYLYVVAGVVIALAASLLVLVVISRARRLRAEQGEATLRARDELLGAAAARWATGDLTVPVAVGDRAVGDLADGFAPALERLRQALVQHVDELARRNETITELVEDLRVQLVQKTERISVLEGDVRGPRRAVPGRIIAGRYQLGRQLGEGGMGTVYHVQRTSDGRALALKLMRDPGEERQRQRFLREARLLAEIHHPNVVRILDVDVDEGQPFLVTEIIDGQNLVGEQAWPFARARPILAGIAAGLAAIHARGIVHRDLKLGNLMTCAGPDGEVVKIVDFGIARDATAPIRPAPVVDPAAAEDTVATGVFHDGDELTACGEMIGTPRYMAPECRPGVAPTAATDVFSFGIVGVRLLSGEFPWSRPAIVLARAGELPPPAMGDPAAMPAPVRALLARCLAPDPTLRPRAAELVVAFASPAA